MTDFTLRPWPRTLHPGVDYSTWPQLKFMRARQLVSELTSRIDTHAHLLPRLLDARLSDDRLSVTFLARRGIEAPVEEWSLLVGDALHNYRSALDALTWELAHLDGHEPTEAMARRIYFPIYTDEADFNKAARTSLATIPKDLLARLWAVQPFHAEPVEDGIAVVLHDLDIADKHRGLLRMTVRPIDASVLTHRLLDDEGSGIDQHHFELIDPPPEDIESYPVFKLTTPRPIAFAEAPMGVPMALELTWGDRAHNLYEILDLVDRQVLATFEMINTGSVSKDLEKANGTRHD